ncbi:MAG: hypothetical protein AB7E85_07495 [Pseudobdellovibrionaceae bacterium]
MSQVLSYLTSHFPSLETEEQGVYAQIDAALNKQDALYIGHYVAKAQEGESLSKVFVIPAAQKDSMVFMGGECDKDESLTVFQIAVPNDVRESVAQTVYSDLMKKRVLDMAA